MALPPPALLSPQLPLYRKGDIQCHTRDVECKSCNCFCQINYRFLEIAPLQLVLMQQRMMKKEKEAFWCWLDVVTGDELELGPPPQTSSWKN